MSFFQRPGSLKEATEQILKGEEPGIVIKNFQHEFACRGAFEMLRASPTPLSGKIDNGVMLDAFIQALAVYLAVKVDQEPPPWTQPPVQLADPWFASPGESIRNYLLISSLAPFRARNLFIDEDSLRVV